MKRLFACTALLLAAFSAQAGIISADFRTEGDLPEFGSVGPLVYERLHAQVGAGYELDDGDFVSNESGWEGGHVWVDWDPLTNTLRLQSQDNLDFQTFRLSLTGIQGIAITGISLLSSTLTDIEVAPLLAFTDDSILISYDVMPGAFHFKGSAIFKLLTDGDPGGAIPEPATLALFGLGAGMLGLARRRLKPAARRG